MAVVILGLFALIGYLHREGTFGRLVSPYLLSAMLGAILSYFDLIWLIPDK